LLATAVRDFNTWWQSQPIGTPTWLRAFDYPIRVSSPPSTTSGHSTSVRPR